MKILAITSKINNKPFENQSFQQNQRVTSVNQTPKYDTVSFGMAKLAPSALDNLNLLNEVRAASKEFIGHLTCDAGEKTSKAIDFLEGLKSKSNGFKNEFALLQDTDGNSQFNVALYHNQPETAKSFLEFVKGLGKETQEKFAVLQNTDGNSQFNYALYQNQPETAKSFLEFAVDVAPKEVLKYEIPEAITTGESFMPIAIKMAGSEQLSKAETLEFLTKYNSNGNLQDLITIVEQNAVE